MVTDALLLSKEGHRGTFTSSLCSVGTPYHGCPSAFCGLMALWNDISKIVTKEEKEPAVSESHKDKAEFEKKQDIALTSLLLTIDYSCIGHVLEITDPFKVDQRFQTLY